MSIMDTIKGLFGKQGETSHPATQVDRELMLQKIRQTDLFRNMPDVNLDQMFVNMETVPVPTGHIIIKEGDEGDYYYLLAEGQARVTRGGKTVADLDEPQGFGEEALISNAKRNATITMMSPGVVMRLSKDGFEEFVKEPLVDWLSPGEAQKKIAEGAHWIDVRDPDSAKADHMHGSLQIPMASLRDKFGEFDKDALYVCYCENGRLSSTAAFLMSQEGFNAAVLRGGLKSLKQAGLS